jgi:hypothetical protein
LIAGLFALGIAVQLYTREIRLYRRPKAWRHVIKADDPGRFWLFVVAEMIALVGAVAEGLGIIH